MTASVFKYLPSKCVQPFVRGGEVLFRSLLYFRACEDARADELDGTHQYQPIGGLPILKGGKPHSIMRGGSLRSSVKRPDELFVFCTSQRLALT
jgi:hypothetical protein